LLNKNFLGNPTWKAQDKKDLRAEYTRRVRYRFLKP